MNHDAILNVKDALLRIRLSKFNTRPIYTIGGWKVFKLPTINTLKDGRNNINYQIERVVGEKIVVRIWLNKTNQIIKSRYYYLESTDAELAGYVVQAFLQKLNLKYEYSDNYTCKDLIF